MRFLAALFLLASTASAQPLAPDPLPDDVRQRLQAQLTLMMEADQRVRYMDMAGTLSPCVADSIGRAVRGETVEESIALSEAVRAEAAARTTPAEREAILRLMRHTDAVNLAQLRAIVAEHGWPSSERTGSDVEPVVFLLHNPHMMGEMREALLAEVRAGRLPARQYAMAEDKARRVRGEHQLYGTGGEYDPATGTIGPPTVESIEATNTARAVIGLEPLAEYRIAAPEATE